MCHIYTLIYVIFIWHIYIHFFFNPLDYYYTQEGKKLAQGPQGREAQALVHGYMLIKT